MTGSATRTQVNIRLDPRDADVLAAVAFLTDVSAAEVLRPIVQEYLRQQRDDAEVRAAFELRARRKGA